MSASESIARGEARKPPRLLRALLAAKVSTVPKKAGSYFKVARWQNLIPFFPWNASGWRVDFSWIAPGWRAGEIHCPEARRAKHIRSKKSGNHVCYFRIRKDSRPRPRARDGQRGHVRAREVNFDLGDRQK